MSQGQKQTSPQFTQPVNQIIFMMIVMGLVGFGGVAILPAVAPIFFASPYLNGFILLVFVVGVFSCLWQMGVLVKSVSWIESFALERDVNGEAVAPRLLASLAALLKKRSARLMLTSTSTRTILDSVATRLDEGREITRYIINLLIFLGLLGTFYGLATTVPAVVDTIRSLAPQEGQDSISVFDNLMTGLESQLGGMGTAFGSSLIGLAGSLVVGLLDLFSSRGQNRFFRELEEWLSSITRLGVSAGNDGDEGSPNTMVAELLEQTTLQIENQQDILKQLQERRSVTDQRIEALGDAVSNMVDAQVASHAHTQKILEQVSTSHEHISDALATQAYKEEIAISERMSDHLENISGQMAKLIDETQAGRRDTIAELRGDLAVLAKALRGKG
ncbi:biopolymer transporter ExbB [Amylibacter sp. SFDW26]|uniref:biopolymer transporter ExbB n=1 Tax=Amylibacter sp. SFDW26 TaxID=2652722 RepID=UPI0012618045|nr:biopolymer transporter ExbB [Amylibacter sp. SFDW26]KAB7610464.1 biopolymer transporter ExbB [Amylibacter sp. SFDW26]